VWEGAVRGSPAGAEPELGEIAFYPQRVFPRAFGQLRNGIPIIEVAGRRAKGQHLTLVIDEQGNGTVTDQWLYQLIRQSGHIADRQFEIEFLDAGVEAFVFTFG
jgi:Thioredoxin like C-terminal domain